jgi:hypothetical protein
MDEPDVIECPTCYRDLHPDEIIRYGYRNTAEGCGECLVACGECGTLHPLADSHDVRDSGHFCEDCVSYCDGCGDYEVNDRATHSDYETYCRRCAPNYGDGSIRGYGHTEGVLWFKTDEDREEGKSERYYLGVELEIHTDNMTAGPIMDWADQHFGNREAIIGKEDSSVEGFEICTQPMTPRYFEKTDWDSFFQMLNSNYPLPYGDDEPTSHGLHVHIGRVAFKGPKGDRDDIMVAAFAYLLAQSDHLERIGRRQPTGYCNKVTKPVSVAVVSSGKADKQAERLRQMGLYPGRDAINLGNSNTIEIRAFKSTRSASEFRDAVRVVYAAAEYVRSLRESKIGMSGKALHWSEFSRWVGVEMPEAFASISGLKK